MNELQVMVDQKVGAISWNFDELKNELAAQMDVYKTIVYTDDNVGDAKKDVAELRKLSKAVNDRKIEIKNKCLEPYAPIEAQAKELIALINEPIALINEKVSDYEKRRKAAKRKKITGIMDDMFADLPEDIREKLKEKVYDTRWENATATEKSYREAIRSAHDDTVNALKLLQNVDEDYRDDAMEVYKNTMDATRAMMKAQELRLQKERILENERIRQEQERIRREAAREAERRAREAAAEVQEAKAEVHEPQPVPPQPAPQPVQKTQEPAHDTNGEEVLSFRITLDCTEAQLHKVTGYIKFIGAEYEMR